MIKILHVFKTYYPYSYGGVEQVIKSICDYVSTKGIISEILISGPENNVFFHEGVKVTVLRSVGVISNNPVSLSFLREFRRIAPQFDVIHFHYPFLMNELLAYTCESKVPYLITYHSDVIRSGLVQFFYKRYSWRFLKKAETVVFTSQNYKEISYTRGIDMRSEVIPLTIESMSCEAGTAVRKIILDMTEDFVLFLGALRRYKGLITLLRAARLSKRKFVIAGDGEEKVALRALASEFGLKNVIFLGSVTDSEKYHLLKKCRFLVLPSDRKSEAFGVVLLEAFSFRKCVLTSDLNTGMAYVNTHDETGRVFKLGDPIDMNYQIEQLYINMEDYDRYCDNALKASVSKFGPLILNRYAEIYREIVDRWS